MHQITDANIYLSESFGG